MSGERKIKCVVWDLDDTLWDGVLLEGDRVSLKERVPDIVRTLDERGILQSVASKNDHDAAAAKLRAFGLHDYFIHPHINWDSKAHSVRSIAGLINIGLDAVAFIDDQPFEREEVSFSLPEVLCIDAAQLDRLLDMPEMNPRFITEDSKARRGLYMLDLERQKAEEQFVGSKEEFLATLGMRLAISRAEEADLQRAEELTVRTHQLNTTGYTYSYEELDHFRRSADHTLLVASLDDKYGSYGKIGLALVEHGAGVSTIKLLLMSCRVMHRGVGSVMLNHIMRLAARRGDRLHAEFVSNGRNRMMYITYKFAGFKEVQKAGDTLILGSDPAQVRPDPDYITVPAWE